MRATEKLEQFIKCLDGDERKRLMLNALDEITGLIYDQSCDIRRLKVAADTYKALAEQRLLNHLEIDSSYIIEVAESLPDPNCHELGQCSYDSIPIKIPNIPVEPIDFIYEPETKPIDTCNDQGTTSNDQIDRSL